jgi:prophage antirepressor-like protein
MDIIKAFENNDMQMHITIQGSHEEPLFRASDIAAVLEMTNIRVMMKDFDATEKGVRIAYTPGGEQEVTFLTEKGLYQVLFTSRKPIAKKFKNWVCDVIKDIRLNGKYELEKQIKDLESKTEENLINNFKDTQIVYLGTSEDGVAKPGITNDFKRRLSEHRRDIRPNFTFDYVYESIYNREIEKRLYLHPEMIKRRIEKIYNNNKNQTELFKLDNKFTIKHIDKIINEIKKEVESEEFHKDKNSEINALKIEIAELKLKDTTENVNQINKLKLELIEKDKLIEELKKQPSVCNPNDRYIYIEVKSSDKNMHIIKTSENEEKNIKAIIFHIY